MGTLSALRDIMRGGTVPSQGVPGAQVRSMGGGPSYMGTLGQAATSTPTATSWDRNAAAYRCISTTAANLASVSLVVMDGSEMLESAPVADLWNQAAPGQAFSARLRAEVIFARAERHGEAFGYLQRETPTSEPTAVWPIYDQVEVLLDDTEAAKNSPQGPQPLGFRVVRQGRKIPLLPDEVLWLRYPHPDTPWAGLAPWKAALAAAELDNQARSWQLHEFLNGARPSMLIYLGDVEESVYTQAKAEFATGVAGPGNAGKSLITAGPTPARMDRMTLSPAEMSYLQSREVNRDEMFLAFGYRPDYFVGATTYANQAAAKTALWSDNYLPKLDVLGSEIDRQLLPDPRQRAGFDVSDVDALRESQDAQVGRVARIMYTDTITIDEGRAELGYEPLPNGAGAVTLTEYRARVAATIGPAGSADSARSTARAVLPAVRVRLVIRTGGQLITPTRRPLVAEVRRSPRRLARTRVLAFYDAHEAIGQRVMRKLAEKQRRITLRNLEHLRTSQLDDIKAYAALTAEARAAGGVLFAGIAGAHEARVGADAVFDPSYWFGQTTEVTEAWLRGVFEGGGVQVAEGLGVSFDSFDDQVLTAMQARRTILATQVTMTTRNAIDSALLEVGAESGWSIDRMADSLRAVFDDLDARRAETIARTEVVGGFNAASNLVATGSGVVTARVWLAAHDRRVRESHAELDGERVEGPSQAYSNGCMFPGDPRGAAEETINCRCVETYELED